MLLLMGGRRPGRSALLAALLTLVASEAFADDDNDVQVGAATGGYPEQLFQTADDFDDILVYRPIFRKSELHTYDHKDQYDADKVGRVSNPSDEMAREAARARGEILIAHACGVWGLAARDYLYVK